MVGCVLRQLKPSELYILSHGKSLGLRPRPFPQLRMFVMLYPIRTFMSQISQFIVGFLLTQSTLDQLSRKFTIGDYFIEKILYTSKVSLLNK